MGFLDIISSVRRGKHHIVVVPHAIVYSSVESSDGQLEAGAFVTDVECRIPRLVLTISIGHFDECLVGSVFHQRSQDIQPHPVVGLQSAESRFVFSPILVKRLDTVVTTLNDNPGVGAVQSEISTIMFDSEARVALTGYSLKYITFEMRMNSSEQHKPKNTLSCPDISRQIGFNCV